jgi:nitrite reductase/ring-hydroxylating ferredoxin subunit
MRDIQDSQLPGRRALLAGAGVTCAAMLAGCTAHDASNGASTPSAVGAATSAVGAATSAVGAATSAAVSAPPAGALATTSQIPDGGGKIIDGVNIVITQPETGSFRAFTAICTHQGCIVNSVSNGTIDCPCHGSKYSIKDGSVVHGPAPSPLAAIAIKVEGTSIFRG